MKSKFQSLTNAYTIGGESVADLARNAVDGARLTEMVACPLCERVYTDDAPNSTPLEEALAAVARLGINPLCSREHAEKLLRQDVAAIVRELARRMEGGE